MDSTGEDKKFRQNHPHKKVNLRVDDIKGMISTYEYLVWNSTGEDKKYNNRVLRQLKKSIKNEKNN